jgi:hypothetical protein
MENLNFETFEKFDDLFFREKIKEMADFVFKSNKDKGDLEMILTRDSSELGMTANGNNYTVDIKEYDFLYNNKVVEKMTCYKSINNDYLYITN